MKKEIELALKSFVDSNHRFKLKPWKGGWYLNKTDGKYAFVGEDLSYKQPKGASWREDINEHLEQYNLKLK